MRKVGPFSTSVGTRGASSSGKTIGLVLANFDYLLYQAKDGETECPDGLVHSDAENWEAQFPTHAQRQRHLSRCGDFQFRGPNCENVWFNPEVIEDPLPFREVNGQIAYGINLDGIHDGRRTEKTCAHEEFISPEGESGVDNQYYRFLGCQRLLRNGVHSEESIRRRIVGLNLLYRLLLEINGVDDERDDDAVEVAMYRGRDPLIVDAAGKAVPWQSQRIDEDISLRLVFRLRGRIADGTLTTEPADVMWEAHGWERRLLIRGMTLRLRLTPMGADALRVGYIDVEQLWQSLSRYATAPGAPFWVSGPSAYAALQRLADGYKDQQTGACTALSSAREYEFVRAHLIHPSKEMNP